MHNTLIYLLSTKVVYLLWIHELSALNGNDLADKLAKEGISLPSHTVSKPSFLLLPQFVFRYTLS